MGTDAVLERYDEAKVVRAQKLWRRRRGLRIINKWTITLAEYKHTSEAKTARRRFKLWNELIQTERTYKNGLDFAVKNYKPKLEGSDFVTPSELAMIFSNIQEIKNIATFIGEQLDKQVAGTTSGAELGSVFIKTLPFLKMYINYATNFERFINVYKTLKANKSFVELEKEITSGQQHLALGDLLITPVQRIPRYKMLFDQIVSLTPKDYTGYDDLVQCNSEITTLCGAINESKKKAESIHHLMRIQRILTGNYGGLLGQGRVYTREGAMQIYVRSDETDAQFPPQFLALSGEYYMFGFDDMVIVSSLYPADKTEKFDKTDKEKHKNNTHQFICAVNFDQIASINMILDKPGAMCITMRSKTESHTVSMYWIAPNNEDIQSWLDAISGEHTKHKPEVSSEYDDDIDNICATLGPRLTMSGEFTNSPKSRNSGIFRSLRASPGKESNRKSLKLGSFSPPTAAELSSPPGSAESGSPPDSPRMPARSGRTSLTKKLSKFFS